MLKTKGWTEKTIVYHIYVRSFKDSDGDGVGDLNGIIEKLNYFNGDGPNSLGIDAIWLSPICTSPQVDFGYDVSDYTDIDPLFGNLETFKKLLDEAHNRGIKVMMDFVPNHTSSQHQWFKESRSSRDNPKHDYYIWEDPKNGIAPNNWLSVFGGSAWEYDKKRGQYYYHSFDREQPDLNWRNPKVVEEMLGILRFWLDLGIDGFRMDAIEWMFKDEQLRDEPLNPVPSQFTNDPWHELIHMYTFALPEVMEIIEQFVLALEEYDDKFLVTEVWSSMKDIVKLYHQIGKKWFTPFNFGLITIPWRAKEHRKFIDEYDDLVGSLYHPNYVLGNHDKSRIVTRIGTQQARIAAMLLLTLRGMPYMYYGDEIGMTDGNVPHEKIQDPFEKRSPGFGLGRDPERTPMQWNAEKHAGFSDVDSWLPVAENSRIVNVESEARDSKSFLSLYKKLIALRQNSEALQIGGYTSYDSGSEDVFVFSRINRTERLLIVLNYSNTNQVLKTKFQKGKLLFNTFLDRIDEKIDLQKFTLGPNEGMVISY